MIAGEVVAVESRLTRSGSTVLTFAVYDGTDTINCIVFLEEGDELGVKKGSWYRVQGSVQYQSYDNQLVMRVSSLAPVDHRS